MGKPDRRVVSTSTLLERLGPLDPWFDRISDEDRPDVRERRPARPWSAAR